MKALTIHLPDEILVEAKGLFEANKKTIQKFRKHHHMTGKAGISDVFRLAIQLGMPLVNQQLLEVYFEQRQDEITRAHQEGNEGPE